jgi:hypothetical protein
MYRTRSYSFGRTIFFLVCFVPVILISASFPKQFQAQTEMSNILIDTSKQAAIWNLPHSAPFNTGESQATVTFTASMAGNVADSDLDGYGDNRNQLPGPAPGLIAAGVDAYGSTYVGNNGTMRMQFEWDLSPLDADASITSATVVLFTHKGSIDSLDTFFYHGLKGQDGLLRNWDFEAPASLIRGVVMPVTPGDSEFSFDVTTLVQDDLDIKQPYFSIQGRVDESLIGGGFKRGLEVWSTAYSHSTDLFPKLIVTYVLPCRKLTLAHTGLGDVPTASPTKSSGCSSGRYHTNEAITVTPHPAAAYHVDHWTGTENPSSNQLTMPASAHTVTAHYAPTCYKLTKSHTGQGSDPAASPLGSTGCENGWYHAREAITMTPIPAARYHLDSWTGTGDPASDQLVMPAGAHTVTAHYEPTCYELTAGHIGQGNDPTASPTHSAVCESGWFQAGESVTMTPHPAYNYHLDHWTGTGNLSSNHLIMPEVDHTVIAHYSISNKVLLPCIVR